MKSEYYLEEYRTESNTFYWTSMYINLETQEVKVNYEVEGDVSYGNWYIDKTGTIYIEYHTIAKNDTTSKPYKLERPDAVAIIRKWEDYLLLG